MFKFINRPGYDTFDEALRNMTSSQAPVMLVGNSYVDLTVWKNRLLNTLDELIYDSKTLYTIMHSFDTETRGKFVELFYSMLLDELNGGNASLNPLFDEYFFKHNTEALMVAEDAILSVDKVPVFTCQFNRVGLSYTPVTHITRPYTILTRNRLITGFKSHCGQFLRSFWVGKRPDDRLCYRCEQYPYIEEKRVDVYISNDNDSFLALYYGPHGADYHFDYVFNGSLNTVALEAFHFVLKTYTGNDMVIHVENEYVFKGFTKYLKKWSKNGWKTRSQKTLDNLALWKKIRDLSRKRTKKLRVKLVDRKHKLMANAADLHAGKKL